MTTDHISLTRLHAINPQNYRQESPYDADAGNLIGRDPREMDVDQLRALGNPTSPIKAIRAKCLDCSCYVQSEVRKCVAHNCALWPFRMGVSPFHASRIAAQNPAANLGAFSNADDDVEAVLRDIDGVSDEQRTLSDEVIA